MTLEELATRIGSHPFLVLGLVAVILAMTSLAALVLGSVVIGNRGRLWSAAVRGWRWAVTHPPLSYTAGRAPRLRRFLHRLTPSEYLLAHLAVGLVASLAAIGFVRLAAAVTGRAAMVRFDLALANALHGAATEGGVNALRALTNLGSGTALGILGVVVLVTLLARKERILAIAWTVAMVGGGVLNYGLKSMFERPRPVFPNPFITAGSWSFPSGHSMSTLIASGMLAYVIISLVPGRGTRNTVIVAAIVWTIFIGFSRMYLGVHYFSDVVAGFAAGTVWLAACISGAELVKRRRGVKVVRGSE